MTTRGKALRRLRRAIDDFANACRDEGDEPMLTAFRMRCIFEEYLRGRDAEAEAERLCEWEGRPWEGDEWLFLYASFGRPFDN